ncbi:MAG TPA: GAF domain-containing protein, partial [Polyangia bacterium]|nr:GAF domain-containing protein [Polyangia bacterium]
MSAANSVGRLVAPGADLSPGPGAVLGGRYRLVDSIGRGAAGETFLAVDQQTAARCAVKLFTGTQTGSTAGTTARALTGGRVAEEFRRLRGLLHPSLVKVSDVGTEAGRAFLVMDLVTGPPLTSIAAIADDSARRRAFENAARALVDAVAYLHGRRLVHADICPTNVRLTDAGVPVLLDFDLSQPASPAGADGLATPGAARGTLGYAAPEALIGQVGPLSDLFSVGATLFEAWTGAAPFGQGFEAVQRMLSTPAPRLSSVRGGLPAAWDDVIARLLAAEPERRLSSARELLREVIRAVDGDHAATEVDLQAPFPGGDPLAGIVVGRRQEQESLRLLIERLAEGAAPCAVAAVVGSAGSGRRTVIELALRDAAVAGAAGLLPPFVVWRGDVTAVERLCADPGSNESGEAVAARPSAGDEVDGARARFAALAEVLETRAALRPLCVVLTENSDGVALARALAAAEPSGNLLVLIAATESSAGLQPGIGPFARTVTIGPLPVEAIGQLIAAAAGQAPPEAAVRAVARSSGGHAATVAALVRPLVEAIRQGRADDFQVEASADLTTLLTAGFRALPAAGRRLLASVALLGVDQRQEAAAPEADVVAETTELLRRAGWLSDSAEEGDRGFSLPSVVHLRVVQEALGDGDLRDIAAAAVARLPPGDVRRAPALLAVGDRQGAGEAYRAAARALAHSGELGRAAEWLGLAALHAPSRLTVDDWLTLTTGLGALGRYAEAEVALDRGFASAVTVEDRLRVGERRAWFQGRQGQTAQAIATLQALLAVAATGPDTGRSPITDHLRGRLGRLLVSAGRFDEAIALQTPVFDGTSASGVNAPAMEAAILARAYVGQLGEARTLHQAWVAACGRAAPDGDVDRPSPGRLLYLGALLDQLDDRLPEAAAGYAQARILSVERHDVHTEAAVALNLAAVLAEQGQYAGALAASERAIRLLGRLGATAELGTALLNAANLFVLIGELGSARRAIARAVDEVLARGGQAMLGYTRFVEGDLQRRDGEPAAALSLYQEAERRLADAGQNRPARAALLSQVEVLAESGRTAEAGVALHKARRQPSGAPLPSGSVPADRELDVAAARWLLAGGAPGEAAQAADASDDTLTPLPLAQRLLRVAGEARQQTRLPLAWRSALLAARLFHHAGDEAAARRSLDSARSIFQEVRMATPDAHRSGLDNDPDARWLAGPAGGASAGAGDAALALRAARSEDRLRRLLRVNKRLNSQLRLSRLLETIIDSVIELTDAERGFILLEDEGGELVVRAARNIDQRTLETAEFELSRSIARRAADGGAPIVTIDAAGDERFKTAMSVSGLHLRSVLAVPLQIKGRAAGTIYVDHRLRKGAFVDEDVSLVLDFAEQAAIAIENARLLSELRRRERQVEALNRRLEIELSARREELTGMKVELRENREALAIRYDYRNIVGRTPRMLELFRLLDRITDTALPVVIQGESGTGKELVARAIHFNGPRRDRPFVSENCAAIP